MIPKYDLKFVEAEPNKEVERLQSKLDAIEKETRRLELEREVKLAEG